MTLGAPVANATLYLIEKVATALISQASEVANEACDRMLVACAEQNGKPQTPCPNRPTATRTTRSTLAAFTIASIY